MNGGLIYFNMGSAKDIRHESIDQGSISCYAMEIVFDAMALVEHGQSWALRVLGDALPMPYR